MIKFLLNFPLLGKVLLIPPRIIGSGSYIFNLIANYIVWIFRSNETTNFTYDLKEINLLYLSDFVATVTGRTTNEIDGYIKEIMTDADLFNHLVKVYAESDQKYKIDRLPKYSKRIGWYAIVRAVKPAIVIETGIDKGLGSCVIASALLKNKSEGSDGFYYGTDINPKAGAFFSGQYAVAGKILIGDSIDSLKNLQIKNIDVFINDSDHSEEYEAKEYETIKSKLNENSIIIGDNSHSNSRLRQFALSTGRKFLFFQEMPNKHWYPGGGIGAAYKN